MLYTPPRIIATYEAEKAIQFQKGGAVQEIESALPSTGASYESDE
ncbi:MULTISPECIES: hypothetical protein [Acidobacterium]|uniref:Uncharacterized protein n=1 Tax=Acidobacterium capsulatum (strain ATCC 51196 / DSM 11244 / BCRC 80197 / JCM 7670 / NBRC 15755 / NCIMB 13165 / 161) TaxID=240015 RepID=C1F5P1_ACIC5|nr:MULTISPECIES: hypothetical protein [Acidobacterium]ACO33180.1 hypothetical protein ACP_3221 [Acidobacterium capsulatum ATCC 51196]